jgi:hypothetical protein
MAPLNIKWGYSLLAIRVSPHSGEKQQALNDARSTKRQTGQTVRHSLSSRMKTMTIKKLQAIGCEDSLEKPTRLN